MKLQGFDIIDNKKLRLNIRRLYDTKYTLFIKKQEYSNDVKFERIKIYSKYFEYNGFYSPEKENRHAKPYDKTSILKDKNFRNEVFISENIQRWIKNDLKKDSKKNSDENSDERIIPFLKNLLKEIDTEIKKLEL